MDDRELDAKVAEKVMGHTITMSDKAWSVEDWLCSDYTTERNTLAIVTDAPNDRSIPPSLVIPHYSTELDEAFQVVEAMAARGLRLSLDRWGGDPWWAEFADEGWEHGGQATSGTAPRAICLAALEALKDTGTSWTTGGKPTPCAECGTRHAPGGNTLCSR